MSFLKNTVSLLALFSVIPASYAVTARVGMVTNGGTVTTASGRRMPTMTNYLGASNAGSTGTTTGTTSSALLANTECIDAYTGCIKGAEACGPNFEECTTKVLFHGKMPQCISTLAQCASAGVSSLFGTSNISALSKVATTNSYGEVTDYTYPTDGSVLGQMITAAAIENKYDTSSCVRRYTSCLKKDSVCGDDFELCTTNTEFRKQRVFCDSTLARCQSDGLIELLGSANMTAMPTASSRIGEMIAEGAALAATNAVSTCYKVADQCILNACGANPYRCYENASQSTVDLVESISTGAAPATTADPTAVLTKSSISGYIKNSCLDTIGANKYCYATFIGEGQMPTASQLRDEDNQEEVYDLAYSSRMNSGMKAKLTDLINKFDTKAKEKCIETMSQCAMRSCGGGSGAACYSVVFGSNEKSINGSASRGDIKTACQSVVDSDPNCKYAAQNPNATGSYTYTFNQAGAFDKLFPEYNDGAESDPIGVVASLNAKLSTSYNTAAIAQMKKRCQSVATSCVKSMCGTDYVNCYRNRTDVESSLTNTGNASFDKSMNKVGGVLDYTIVLGMCIDTVKNADVCEEHLKIEEVKYNLANKDNSANSWGGPTDARSGWLDAGFAKSVTGGEIYATDENGNNLCTNAAGVQGICDTVDATGAVYSQPVVIGYDTYVQTQAARSLFKDLIYDLEIEAQAKYNAKLTKQQNMCLSYNQGGIMGNKDNGSAYMWVKLKSNKVPNSYATSGLKPSQFAASNDLYGSFCRIRVTLHSEDRDIQEAIADGADWSTAYFAAGDPFTCGSWIPQAKLDEIAESVGKRAYDAKADSQFDYRPWTTILGSLGGGVGGAYLGKGISDGSVFGGLTGNKKADVDDVDTLISNCKKYADNGIRVLGDSSPTKYNDARRYAQKIEEITEKLDNEQKVPSSLKNTREATYYCNCFDKDEDGNKEGEVKIRENSCKKGEYDDGCSHKCDKNDSSGVSAGTICSLGKKIDDEELSRWFEEAKETCNLASESDMAEAQRKKTRTSSAIGAGVGALGGGILAYTITDTIMDHARDEASRQAIAEFMENVGSKIHCYIGGEEAGSFGETVVTSME